MKYALLIAALLLIVGCASNTVLGSKLHVLRMGIRSNAAHETYRDAIGDHAEDDTLVGTWTWLSPERAVFDLPLQELSLSLFEEGTYMQRRLGRSTQNTFFGIRVEEGTWEREAPGRIALSPNEPKPTYGIVARTIDLDEWTNVFVESQQSLHENEP
ncbi:MAG: hypothetical protein KTR15_11500 [Phycisphaeraceae bacterium]|nr:hypothetical protein [Phycisphaeraceae bacterium]